MSTIQETGAHPHLQDTTPPGNVNGTSALVSGQDPDRMSIQRAPIESVVGSAMRAIARYWTLHYADIIALTALIAMTGTGLWLRWVYDNWLGEFDILTMFIPWFGYIGDRIAAGEIPAWSPHYFGGAPVAGNPSGGWMYIQVMVLYAIFPILVATKMLLLSHAVISGAALYGFCRKLRMAPVAALMSSSIFVLGQILYGGTNYMTIATQASTWLVVGLLASEMGIRATRMPGLLGWSALLGVAISQMFMSWPGQGVAYGCMWIGGWMAYRLILDPPPEFETFRERFWQSILVGSTAVFATLAFGAAGILPMLDFLSESTVPNGNYDFVIGGSYAQTTDSLQGVLSMLMRGTNNFAFTVPSESFGATVMILAIFGAFRARKQYGAAFFGVMFVGALSLTVTHSPTLWLFEKLPVIGPIHDHRPSGVSWMVAIGTAMLAGAAIQKLIDADRPPLKLWHVTSMVMILAAGFATVNSMLNWVGWWAWGAALATIFLYAVTSVDFERAAEQFRPYFALRIAGVLLVFSAILVSGYMWTGFWPVIAFAGVVCILLLVVADLPGLARRWQPRLPILVGYGLIGLVFLAPTGWDIYATVRNPETEVGGWTNSPGKEPASDLVIQTSMLREEPGTAAEFLQKQQALVGPFRYTGFSLQGEIDTRWTGQDKEGHKSGYSWRRMEPGVLGILVNARTYRLDLYQTGGYNPIQLRFYTEYVDVMNGRRQDYHWLDTFGPALSGSQLLDMLNVRYVVVDKSIPEYRSVFQAIEKNHVRVYEDDLAIVYENPNVFPHAWVVHDVQDNGTGFGLRMLASDNIDGRETAFVNTEGELPTTEPKISDDVLEYANVVRYDPEHITLNASADTDGFLVMSDSYATGWNAYVDGKKTEVYRTDHAFRGIKLPAGKHTVEFKYEPESLRVGLMITSGATLALVGIWSWALVDWRRRGSRGLPVAIAPVISPEPESTFNTNGTDRIRTSISKFIDRRKQK